MKLANLLVQKTDPITAVGKHDTEGTV